MLRASLAALLLALLVSAAVDAKVVKGVFER